MLAGERAPVPYAPAPCNVHQRSVQSFAKPKDGRGTPMYSGRRQLPPRIWKMMMSSSGTVTTTDPARPA